MSVCVCVCACAGEWGGRAKMKSVRAAKMRTGGGGDLTEQ